MLDGNKLGEQLETQVFQNEHFNQMHEKMTTYFNQKSEDNAKKGQHILDQMNAMLDEMKTVKEQMTNLNQKYAVNKDKHEEVMKQKEETLVDVTEALKGYKLRSEIERAFFFHLFYEILRQQFGLTVNGKEKDIFDR